MSSVFISHSSKDSVLAEDLYHALERARYEAYLVKKALEVGKEYNVAIAARRNTRRAVPLPRSETNCYRR